MGYPEVRYAWWERVYFKIFRRWPQRVVDRRLAVDDAVRMRTRREIEDEMYTSDGLGR